MGRLRTLLLVGLTAWLASGDFPLAAAHIENHLIRLDTLLTKAEVKAPAAASNAISAEPLIWSNFFSIDDIRWQALRGRTGVRNGDLMLKGEGSTPVIAAPAQPPIDLSLYSALEIRMSASAGQEVKIKIGPAEKKQKLGPANLYNVYRFELDLDRAIGTKPLAIMPTDSVNGLIAIHSIKLIPKPAQYASAAGIMQVANHDEYRQAIYTHCPSIISFPITVPSDAQFHFGMALAPAVPDATFRVAIEGEPAPLFSKRLVAGARWEDANVSLSRFSGKNVRLRLEIVATVPGAVAYWSMPVIVQNSDSGKPNILVYMIDTLRPDHSSVYGYQRNTTPFLKRLASGAVVFDDCQSQASWTKPAVASLMTSLYSLTHGIATESDTIPQNAILLASELQKGGYVTASFIGTPFAGRTTGLDRGFDYLTESPVITALTTSADRATDSAALNRALFPWLDRHHNEPFFLYAHTTDPHAPYNPPARFESIFANPAETARFERNYLSFRSDHEHGGGAVLTREMCSNAGIDPDAFIRQAQDRYDAEILNNDHNFEELVTKLKQIGILNNTLIVVVSDHGEEFWDHGWTGHGQSVYQELTHTMLLVWNPALFPRPRRVSEPVQLIDVMPTLLDIAGLKQPSLIEGQSLVPLARGQAFRRRGLVVSSRFAVPNPDRDIVPENKVDSFAIIDNHWKLIFRNQAARTGIRRVELYDRIKDRVEQQDVAAGHPEEVEHLVSALHAWIDAQNHVRAMVGRPENSTLDPATIQRLKSLGYLGGTN